MGISVASSRVGYVSWEGPAWAFAGNYQLCWCGADATTTGCKSPKISSGNCNVNMVRLTEATSAMHTRERE